MNNYKTFLLRNKNQNQEGLDFIEAFERIIPFDLKYTNPEQFKTEFNKEHQYDNTIILMVNNSDKGFVAEILINNKKNKKNHGTYTVKHCIDGNTYILTVSGIAYGEICLNEFAPSYCKDKTFFEALVDQFMQDTPEKCGDQMSKALDVLLDIDNALSLK